MIPTAALTSHRLRDIRVQPLLLAGALLLWPAPAPAQTLADRQSDKAVAAVIAQVETARDKFEGALDGSLKDSVLRSATGEVKVSASLQDLKDNIKKLKDRFTPGYAASAELEVVLKQCNNIDAFIQATPSVTKGRSEWEQLASKLKTLAGVYGATFPLLPGTPVRRMSDTETSEAVGALAESANQFKSAIGQDKAVVKADQDAGKKLADNLSKSAKVLKSRLADGKPASTEAKAVMDQAAALDAFAKAHPSLQSAASLSGVTAALAKIHQAFGITAPGR